MKKIQFALYLFISICLCSCEKDSDIVLPKVEEKLVIGCAISPQDSLIKVNVSLSQPIFNTSPSKDSHLVVTNATVIISSHAGSWTLLYDAIRKQYIIDTVQLKVKAGLTYNLSVSTPEGKFVKAVTTIPYQNNTLSCTTSPDPTVPDSIKLRAMWSDPLNSTDYYKFEMEFTMLLNYWYQPDVVSDEGNEGGISKRELTFHYDPSLNAPVYAVVNTLSPELYNYYTRLKQLIDSSGPFAEPIPMYTNIEGGFGIFGSFNKYKLKVLP